jgi:hypothetical protein
VITADGRSLRARTVGAQTNEIESGDPEALARAIAAEK